MKDNIIIEKTVEEIVTENLAVTKQFLKIHKMAYHNGQLQIARVDRDKVDEAIVYFNVKDETFYLAVYVDLKPDISVKWTVTEPYHSVYFRASSDKLSLTELAQLTKLTSSRGRNKGDKKRVDGKNDIVWKQSTIDFEPNPEADEFEDKLTNLLNYLEQDKEGTENLVNNANGYIQVYSSFHQREYTNWWLSYKSQSDQTNE